MENAPAVTPGPPAAAPCTLFDLTATTCRWPLNDGWPQFIFCGEPADEQPYCPAHRRMAYHPTPVRKAYWPTSR